MHPDTYDVRKQAHLLSDITLSETIADYLVHNANVGSQQGIDETPINDEIRTAVFGDSYPDHVAEELNDTIGELTRPRGAVYDMLDNGYGTALSLCTARVRRKIKTADGGSIIVAKMSRFVSDDPDVVQMFRMEPQVQRLEKTMERLAVTIAEDTRRIPALQSRIAPLLSRANDTMQRELPRPRQGDGS
jgi:hypothetical protein